jgi:uncharacterized protein (TIGR02145 family)
MLANEVVLTWKQENQSISGFKIFRKVTDGNIESVSVFDESTISYNDGSILPGKKYTYYLVAVAGTNISDTIKTDITPIFLLSLIINSVNEISDTSALVASDVFENSGDSVIRRGVCWSTNPSPTINNSNTKDGSGFGKFNTRLTGLLSGTKYFIRAYGESKRGLSYSSEISFTTLGVPKVTTAQPSNITSNSARSGGTITSDGGLEIVSRGVCFSLSPNPTIDSLITVSGSGLGGYQTTMTNLKASTTYYVRSFAKNNLGVGYGDEYSFTTLAGLPSVSTLSISDITHNEAIAGGNVSSDGGFPITARGVCWSTSPNPTINNSKTVDGIGIGGFQSNITGILPTTTYYIRAYAANVNGTTYGVQQTLKTYFAPLYTNGSGVADIDGYTYKTVIIGNQEWMAENLRVSRFQNGDIIEEINLIDQWRSQSGSMNKALKGVINGSSANFQQYGYIYNYRAMIDSRGVCPIGYKVPSLAEWKELEAFVNIDSASFRMKSKLGWTKGLTGNGVFLDYNGDNLSGINALPGGGREYTGDNDGLFYTSFWTSSPPLLPVGFGSFPAYAESIVLAENNFKLGTYSSNEYAAIRIRCIKIGVR